jgi:hypothetical protein
MLSFHVFAYAITNGALDADAGAAPNALLPDLGWRPNRD